MTILRILLLLLLASPARADCPVRAEALEPGGTATLPPVSVLLTIFLSEEPGGPGRIERAAPLPRGGIDGRHLCGWITLVPFRDGRTGHDPSSGGRRDVEVLGLLLHGGVDYATEYPHLRERLVDGRELWTASAGRWRIRRVGDAERRSPAFQAVLPEGCDGVALVLGEVALVPDC